MTEAGIGEAALDARLLLEYACGITHETLLAHSEQAVAEEKAASYLACIQKRAARTPVAYITGTQEFMGLSFHVNEHVLIPNQDTETLVEAALECLRGDKGDTPATDGSAVRILDLCTGSGCVGLSLLHYSSESTLVATDISKEALAVARENAEMLGVADRAAFVCCDVYPPPLTHFDLIVANPPYIKTDVIETLAPEVRCAEPVLALDGGADGLAFYRRILKDVGDYLTPGGYLLTEIGYDEGAAVAGMLEAAGFKEVHIIKDLNGLDRVVVGHR